MSSRWPLILSAFLLLNASVASGMGEEARSGPEAEPPAAFGAAPEGLPLAPELAGSPSLSGLSGQPDLSELHGLPRRTRGLDLPQASLPVTAGPEAPWLGIAAVPPASGKAVSAPLPAGVSGVVVHKIRNRDDANRRVPARWHEARALLKRALKRFGPLRLLEYQCLSGQPMLAVDLSDRPELFAFPGLDAHEIEMLRKLRSHYPRLALLLPESGEMPGSGKTPDLVLGDRIAELKARRSNTTDIGAPLHDAEAQLREHAERHGLGQGVVVIELTTFKAVPVEEVRQKLNRWSSERPLHFDHVLILAGDDLKIFERGQDGAFRLARGQELPAAAVAGRAADARAGRRLLSELGANADHPERAWQIWQAFRREHPEQVGELWPQVQRFLPFAGPLAPASPPPLDSERLLNEYLEPERLLREGGVQAAVFVSGGASVARGSRYYEEARRFGELVARYGQGLALATGGGPGIMEAANRGAFEAGGPSVGFRIILPAFVEEPNLYITPGLNFDFDNFQMRKLHLLRWASAVVCFPGAFGTLDELSEVLTLAQTGKLSPVPIILVGEREWKDLDQFFRRAAAKGRLSAGNLERYTIVETAEQAWLELVSLWRGRPS